MTKYTNEKKEHALSQMSATHNNPVAEVAQLTGVPGPVLRDAGTAPQRRCRRGAAAKRRVVYAQARERHPLRWKRPPRAWQVVDEVWLNPPSKLDQRRAA